MRWLITGASGLLGPFLVEACSYAGAVTTTSQTDRAHPCDLTDPKDVHGLITAVRPDVVVNAAAMTDVDGCERHPGEATALNSAAVGNIVAGLRDLDTPSRLVQISTDQVYPDVAGPHAEERTGPVNVYGRTKLAGEGEAVAHPGALVLRANFFAASRTPGRRSLSDFIIDNLRAGRAITLFDDVQFSPLHAATLARLIVRLVSDRIGGVFNAGSRAGASKADFGLSVARHLGLPTETATIGTSTSDPNRAARPRDLRMDASRLEAETGMVMPTLQDEISRL